MSHIDSGSYLTLNLEMTQEEDGGGRGCPPLSGKLQGASKQELWFGMERAGPSSHVELKHLHVQFGFLSTRHLGSRAPVP